MHALETNKANRPSYIREQNENHPYYIKKLFFYFFFLGQHFLRVVVVPWNKTNYMDGTENTTCTYVCMYAALLTHQYVTQMGRKTLHLHES